MTAAAEPNLDSRPASVRSWFLLTGAVVGSRTLLDEMGVASATIVAALIVGVVLAIRTPKVFHVGARPATVAQALVGVVLGTQITRDTFSDLGGLWGPVALVTVASIALSFAVGVAVFRTTKLDAASSTLAMVPGGALGIVAMTRELGGDERMVALSQYFSSSHRSLWPSRSRLATATSDHQPRIQRTRRSLAS